VDLFKEEQEKFRDEFRVQTQILLRYDQVLDSKANKVSLS